MTAQADLMVTDYDWCETSRPTLILDGARNHALLYVGGFDAMKNLPVEITGSDSSDLRSLLEGYVEIFELAIDQLRIEEHNELAKQGGQQ